MRRITGLSLLVSSALALPALAFAQATASQGLLGTLQFFNRLFNGLVGLFITLAIVLFFWGLVTYLASDGEWKAKGLTRMMFGIIAIFVMVSIWGLVALLQNTFGVQQNTARTPASVPLNYGN